MLSWGKNSYFNELLYRLRSMYDKFRAVSSIQELLELCFPVLAIMDCSLTSQLGQKKMESCMSQ
jgi:hypothetical protein